MQIKFSLHCFFDLRSISAKSAKKKKKKRQERLPVSFEAPPFNGSQFLQIHMNLWAASRTVGRVDMDSTTVVHPIGWASTANSPVDLCFLITK